MIFVSAVWYQLSRPHIWMVFALVAGSFSKVVPDVAEPYVVAAETAFTGIAALTMQWTKAKETSP